MGRKRQVTYVKFWVQFRCSSENCRKTWSSAHGWRENNVLCEFCDDKCKIVNVKDEMLELDNYGCPRNHWWQSIHDDGIDEQECEVCGEMGIKDGTQNRFGRHFWFRCKNKKCSIEWEDFSLVPGRTQRCSKKITDGQFSRPCAARGDVIKVERINPRWWRMRRGRGGGRGGSGHAVELCDMCQDLQSQGFEGNCKNYRKVKCEVFEDGHGGYSEKIVGVGGGVPNPSA